MPEGRLTRHIRSPRLEALRLVFEPASHGTQATMTGSLSAIWICPPGRSRPAPGPRQGRPGVMAKIGFPRVWASELGLPPGDLLRHTNGRGAAETRPGPDRILDPEHVVDALVDARLDRLHGIEGQLLEAAAATLGLG